MCAQRKQLKMILALVTATASIFGYCALGMAAPVTFTDRATFLLSVGATITDGYDEANYGNTFPTPLLLTDAQMSSAFNETKYRSTSSKDLNLVGPVYGNNLAAYCAGCNGSFALDFTSTSIGDSRGVFGFGMDIGLNGGGSNGFPSNTPDPYHAFITFGDGTQQDFTLPDVLDPFGQSRFFGIISDNRIMSAAIGGPNGAPINRAAFFGMDNLTITAVPGPSTGLLVTLTALAWTMGAARRRHRK